MLDTRMRALTAPPLQRAATRLADGGITPLQLTLAGWAGGVGACIAAGLGRWHLALLLWLANRLLDGLDGAVARLVGPTDRGGLLDLVADFSVYAGFVLGVAVAVPEARLACVALLTAYYLSGTAFLTLSSLLERRRHAYGDERSLRFVGGLAEGTETVAVYVLLTLLPSHATALIWTFAAAVAVTAAQRVRTGVRLLATSPAAASAVRPPLSHVA
jgi:phosphatidylglycerophosphate synthase